MIRTNAVAVTDAVTRLDPEDKLDYHTGYSLIPYNDGANAVYVGGPDVTATGATKGAPVAAGAYGIGYEVEDDEGVWGVCAAGQSTSVIVTTEGVA